MEFSIEHLVTSAKLFQPETALVVTFLVALIFDLIFKKSKNITAYISLIGFIVTGFLLSQQESAGSNIFASMLAVDSFGQFFKWIILLSSFIVVWMSFFSKELYEDDRKVGEYYSLIVGMSLGMFLLTSATNLIMIYLSIEIMSISSYVLAGYTKEIKRSSEASLKYVIFGAVSSGIMIYGISIIYGLTGSLNLYGVNVVLQAGIENHAALIMASLMIVAGFGYKISAVPFHFWTPDVYEGAPVTVTALLSVASKAAGFAVLIRFFRVAYIGGGADADGVWTLVSSVDWKFIIAVISVLTMTIGNFVAVWQTNVKRLLAYSSIAHAGYMLMGVVVMNDVGVTAVLVYFFVYLFMNLGAFLYVELVANKIGSEELDDYVGIGYRAPILASCMVLFLISLTGLPPTAGFIGKFYIFSAVLNSDYIWLAVVGVVNSVVSLFFYVKVFRNMFLRGVDKEEEAFHFSPGSIVLLVLLAIPTLLFGIYWSPIAEWAQKSAAIFLG